MITRCPSCETSFRITESQLKSAKGAVRCGSCLHIFKALDNLVTAKTPSPKKKPVTEQQTDSPDLPASETPKPTPTIEATPSQFEYKRPASADSPEQHEGIPAQASAEPAKPTEPDPLIEPEHFLPEEQELAEEDSTKQENNVPVDHEQEIDGAEEDILEIDSSDYEEPPLPSIIVEDEELEYEEIEISAAGTDEAENLHLESTTLEKELGQENMLTFDQTTIDSPSSIKSEEDDLLISDDMPLDDEPEVSPSSQAYGDDLSESFLDINVDSWKPKENSLFDRKEKQDDDDDDKDTSDESWAVNLLDEMDEDESDNQYTQPDSPESEEAESLLEEYSPATTGTFTALDDEDIEEALGAPLSEHFDDPKDDDVFIYKDRLDTGEFDAVKDHGFAEPENSGDHYTEEPSDDYRDESEDGYYSDGENRAALLRGIEPEPVEMAGENYGHWRKKAIYAGTVTLGLLLLVTQVAWLQFDTLSHDPKYRSWYTFFGIDVPSVIDKSRIRANNLVVRSHPETSNALIVDTVLLNTATHSQPFPELVLSFSNLKGDVLAARAFKPEEYLSGELAGKRQMPQQQPVHLSLEIVDPGPEAINYAVYIP